MRNHHSRKLLDARFELNRINIAQVGRATSLPVVDQPRSRPRLGARRGAWLHAETRGTLIRRPNLGAPAVRPDWLRPSLAKQPQVASTDVSFL